METVRATVMGGIPAHNLSLYRRIRFKVGDPAAILEIPGRGAVLILRDIEMDRARRHARADEFFSPADFPPAGGTLSGDREVATAQATAECLRRAGVSTVWTDRTLPMIFAHQMQEAGITVRCDPDMGVVDRRSKDAQEIELLRDAQRVTEEAMAMACRLVARADAGAGGALQVDGQPLTAEVVRRRIDIFLLERGYVNPPSIVAGGPQGADCHDIGSGVLHTGQPVIIDIFPQNRETLYNGDCTRTVVHGEVPEAVQGWHAAVVEAKAAAIAAVRPGVTGEEVHNATARVIRAHGYEMGLPPAGAPTSYTGMVHGTGHGVGLEVHEPPLLDRRGPALLIGDALTIEPGLYCHDLGGLRIEDMVIVTDDGCINLNELPEGLDWS
ncbi:MAG: aminopeptidase P family protein [Phycisphaerales bacterium]|nr:aminopeptidase P family protein [Phycisphaerales bacterium]